MYLKVEANAFASPPVLFSLFAPDLAIYQASLMQRMVKKIVIFSTNQWKSYRKLRLCPLFLLFFSRDGTGQSLIFLLQEGEVVYMDWKPTKDIDTGKIVCKWKLVLQLNLRVRRPNINCYFISSVSKVSLKYNRLFCP